MLGTALRALLALVAATTVGAASPADRQACLGTDNTKKAAACTRVINDRSTSRFDRAIAHAHRGQAYYFTEDDRAVADFDTAIRLMTAHLETEPKDLGALLIRGVCHLYKSNDDSADADFTKLMQLARPEAAKDGEPNAGFRQVFLLRAAVRFNQGRYASALEDIELAARFEPKQAPVLQARAAVLVKLGNFERAIDDATLAIKLMPESDSGNATLKTGYAAWRTRGMAYAGQGDHDRALADYDKALSLNPRDTASLYRRGVSFLAKGEVGRAIADKARAETVQPNRYDMSARKEHAKAKDALEALLQQQAAAGAAAAAAPALAPTAPLTRVALVIGNTRYRGPFSALKTPQADARAIAAALRKVGFLEEDVIEKHDLDRKSMIAILRQFQEKARRADWALVFFAGHGVRARSNMDYLIPIDADISTESDLADEAVPLERVVERIGDARKLQVVIFDACRDNQLSRRLYASPERERSGAASRSPIEAPGLVLAFSAKRGQSAFDGETHSPFATALLAHLEVPGIDFETVLVRTADRVRRETAEQQTPEVFGAGYGRAIILQPAANARQ